MTLLVMGAGLLSLAVPAAPSYADPTSVLSPIHLKRGPTAHFLYSDGARLHLRDGGTVSLPRLENQVPVLMGKSRTAWFFWTGSSSGDELRNRVTRVGVDGTPSVIFRRVVPYREFDDYSFWYGLSTNGRRFVENVETDEGVNGLIVRNLAGKEIGRTIVAKVVMDFSGPRMAYIDQGLRAYVWKPGHKPRQVADRVANYAELAHDIVFLQTPDGQFGPTRLSHPGQVRWEAHFQATLLSPDGTRVLGVKKGSHSICGPFSICEHEPVFQIRRMKDGAVLSSFQAHRWGQDIRWENNRAVLFPVRRASDGKYAVARCKVAGGCNRASSWMFAFGGLSFPTTPDLY